MTHLVIDTHLIDVGANHQTSDSFINSIIQKTAQSWESGADIVLLPEYSWMNLTLYRNNPFELQEFANYFWQDVFPALAAAFNNTEKMAVLGTVPAQTDRGLVNRAIIVCDGKFTFQDKLAMTPWENQLVGGDTLSTINYKNTTCCILTCLDIEIPSLAEKIKRHGAIDLILVPSATENLIGVERVARCASARAVELSTAVVTCALIGAVKSNEFIDVNIGRSALYMPSQPEFTQIQRITEAPIQENGNHTSRFEINIDTLRNAKRTRKETNPANIFPLENIQITPR